jgi:hypothetical protein
MPFSAPITPIASGDPLDAAQPWADLTDARTWANGGANVAETDFDSVKGIHLPRPQLFGFPRNAMLGETQDVYGQANVTATGPKEDAEMKHRQIIFADCLDTRYSRVRVAGCVARFRMPTYGRVTIEATISHRCWPYTTVYGGAATDPTGYFSLWYGPTATAGSAAAPTEITSSRRATRRQVGTVSNLDPGINFCNMMGMIDTKVTAVGDTDMVVFAAFTATASTYFQTGTGAVVQNRNRVDVLNTAFVVHVFKNVLD